jgi:hypothetical protein
MLAALLPEALRLSFLHLAFLIFRFNLDDYLLSVT